VTLAAPVGLRTVVVPAEAAGPPPADMAARSVAASDTASAFFR
jgi:hypothetical protein